MVHNTVSTKLRRSNCRLLQDAGAGVDAFQGLPGHAGGQILVAESGRPRPAYPSPLQPQDAGQPLTHLAVPAHQPGPNDLVPHLSLPLPGPALGQVRLQAGRLSPGVGVRQPGGDHPQRQGGALLLAVGGPVSRACGRARPVLLHQEQQRPADEEHRQAGVRQPSPAQPQAHNDAGLICIYYSFFY